MSERIFCIFGPALVWAGIIFEHFMNRRHERRMAAMFTKHRAGDEMLIASMARAAVDCARAAIGPDK